MLCNLFTISLFSRSILVVYFTFSLTSPVFTFRDNFHVSLIHIKAWITPKIPTSCYNNFWATFHFYFLFFNNVLFYDKVFLNIRTRTVKHKTWCETSGERKWCSITEKCPSVEASSINGFMSIYGHDSDSEVFPSWNKRLERVELGRKDTHFSATENLSHYCHAWDAERLIWSNGEGHSVLWFPFKSFLRSEQQCKCKCTESNSIPWGKTQNSALIRSSRPSWTTQDLSNSEVWKEKIS